MHVFGNLLLPLLSILPFTWLQSFPSFVHCSGAPSLTTLQYHHISPLRHVYGIDISAWLNADACPGRFRRTVLRHWDVNELSGVELEGWLGTGDIQSQAGASM